VYYELITACQRLITVFCNQQMSGVTIGLGVAVVRLMLCSAVTYVVHRSGNLSQSSVQDICDLLRNRNLSSVTDSLTSATRHRRTAGKW